LKLSRREMYLYMVIYKQNEEIYVTTTKIQLR